MTSQCILPGLDLGRKQQSDVVVATWPLDLAGDARLVVTPTGSVVLAVAGMRIDVEDELRGALLVARSLEQAHLLARKIEQRKRSRDRDRATKLARAAAPRPGPGPGAGGAAGAGRGAGAGGRATRAGGARRAA